MSEANDIEYIKNMLIKLSDKQDSMNDRLNDIDTHLTKISTTVIGDKQFGHPGLVRQVEKINKYIDGDKLRNAGIVGGLGVIGILWTIFLKLIKF